MSKSTALTIITTALPAHLQKSKEQLAELQSEALGGIKLGGFARLSISGGKFHFVKGGEVHLITDPRDNDKPSNRRNPLMTLPVVIVKANPALSKQFYAKQYNPGAADEPDCASDDGLSPNSGVPNKQSNSCATCPHNKWGSRKTPNGKDAKACSDIKRLALVPANDLNFEPLALAITPSALKAWGGYVKALGAAGRGVNEVVTELSFDSNADYPRLLFNFGRDLDEDEHRRVLERRNEEGINNLLAPKGGFEDGEVTQETEPVVPVEKNHKPAEDAPISFGAPKAAPVEEDEEEDDEGEAETPVAEEKKAPELPFGAAPAKKQPSAEKQPAKEPEQVLSKAPAEKVVKGGVNLNDALAKALSKKA